MATAPSRLLIFGATGAIGKYITSSLVSASPPTFKQITIFTSASTSSTKTKSDLLFQWKSTSTSPVSIISTGDITDSSSVAAAYAVSQADTVISCLGRDAISPQIELLRLAEASGTVKWFFPSEYGTDIEHNADKSPHEKPHQQKLAVRRYIRENISRVQVTYLVTGPYFDMWVDLLGGLPTVGGFDVPGKKAYLQEDGEGKIGFCTMRDVGKALLASLRHPEASYGKALKVQSFVVTPNEVLAEYEKQTGGRGAKWDVTYTPRKEIEEIEARSWAEGHPKATGITLRRIWGEGGTLYAKNDNEVIGLREGDMDSLAVAVERKLSGEK